MALATLGINHRTANVAFRERVAFTRDTLPAALHELTALPEVDEALILSTCSRTELYLLHGAGDDLSKVFDWLCRWHRLGRDEMAGVCYEHHDEDVVRHAIRVAAGLDSMVPGEPEIFGQFKQAWRDAREAGTLGRELQNLAEHTFAAAKQIRSDSEISRHPVSLAHAAVSLTRDFFEDLETRRALVVGAGETAQLAARYLHRKGIGQLTIANRSLENAQALAQELLAQAVPVTQLRHALAGADIVLSCTSSPVPVLGKGLVEAALARRHRPIYMVDLAVPRDIEPQVADLADVYLYTLDDLQKVVQQNLERRKSAQRQGHEMLEAQVRAWQDQRQAASAFSMIRDYRAQAGQVRSETLEQARRKLAVGQDPEAVLEWLANTLTGRLLHHPTQALNEAGKRRDEELLHRARTLLNLPPPQ